ncbi:MAG: tRNA pseudouridine(38-40) synthase TruA [Desulfobacteraceae bacterium]|nr:tRNA pseudouridine(38-40) synthase TruA [Desulfobacteraceae bacterium]
MMKNFKLTIEYDGTDFNGWQVQKTGRTVQGETEAALFTMTRQKVRVTGSGRTDAGVHALGQTAHFRCQTRLGAPEFMSGLNSLLPPDIVIKACEQVPLRFHAQYSAKKKTYRYNILNRSLPAAVGRQYSWHIQRPLDINAMQQAANSLIGTHDFSAFENTGSPRSDSLRTVYSARFIKSPDDEHLCFEISANGFLRYMVRNIMGTLVLVGQSKITPREFAGIKQGLDRSRAGATAPPHGLFLISVTY